MLRPTTNRRRLLSRMVLATVAAALPASAAEVAEETSKLIAELKLICSWVRMEEKEGGLEIHCGIPDRSPWDGCPVFLTKYSKKIFASGDRLTLTLPGGPAALVLHPLFS